MNCGCIGIYRAECLDESYREILRKYQKIVIEDTCWFSIELEWHMKHAYTEYEKKQLTEVFGSFLEQEILIFGACDRIFVVAYEIIKHLGGLLRVNLADYIDTINTYPGIKIAVYKKHYKDTSKHEPDYYMVDHIFIRQYFAKGIEHNFDRFRLAPFLPIA